MDDYTITFARAARKELEALSASVVNRVFPKLESLAQNPRPRGCRKLKGEKIFGELGLENTGQSILQMITSERSISLRSGTGVTRIDS